MALSKIKYSFAVQDVKMRLDRLGLSAEDNLIIHLIDIEILQLASSGQDGSYLESKAYTVGEDSQISIGDRIATIDTIDIDPLNIMVLKDNNHPYSFTLKDYKQFKDLIPSGTLKTTPVYTRFGRNLLIYYPEMADLPTTVTIDYNKTPKLATSADVIADGTFLDIRTAAYPGIVDKVVDSLKSLVGDK